MDETNKLDIFRVAQISRSNRAAYPYARDHAGDRPTNENSVNGHAVSPWVAPICAASVCAL